MARKRRRYEASFGPPGRCVLADPDADRRRAAVRVIAQLEGLRYDLERLQEALIDLFFPSTPGRS